MSRNQVRQVTFAEAPKLDEEVGELQGAGLLVSTREALSPSCHPYRQHFASWSMGHFPELWMEYFGVNGLLT